MNTDFHNVRWEENGKIKLLIIAGTRPEIIRLSCVIDKCRDCKFNCVLSEIGM